MFKTRFAIKRTLSVAIFAAALGGSLAKADEYGDVNQLMRNGKSADALTRADQYLASKPRDPQMRFLKGVILTESGKPTDAINIFTKLTEDFPELPEPYNNLAVLYAGQSQFDKARAALEMAIRTNPSYSTAHENLGDVYAKLASQAYTKALQLDAGNAAVPPKLALIKDLFAPGNKAQRPVAATPTPAPQAQPAAPKPAVAPSATTTTAPPAAAVEASTPNKAQEAKSPERANGAAVEAAVKAWASAWSSKDVKSYLAAYSAGFKPNGGQSRKTWEDDRRKRIEGKSRINVKLTDFSVTRKSDTQASVRFKQDYSADSLQVSSRKTLDLVQSGGKWLIERESTGN
jgi:tetratricopeptide (TPR) repeat protein